MYDVTWTKHMSKIVSYKNIEQLLLINSCFVLHRAFIPRDFIHDTHLVWVSVTDLIYICDLCLDRALQNREINCLKCHFFKTIWILLFSLLLFSVIITLQGYTSNLEASKGEPLVYRENKKKTDPGHITNRLVTWFEIKTHITLYMY